MTAKSRDRHGRWRARTIGFRVSDSENEEINEMVRLSGLTKQEYIITKLLNKDVVVMGSPRVYKALKDTLAKVLDEMHRLTTSSDFNEKLAETINIVANILGGMNHDRRDDR